MKFSNTTFITTRLLIVSLTLLCCAFLNQTAHAAENDRFPFVLPWDDATPTITSVANLNPVPAGNNGFIAARNGHFFDEKGRRIRFIGVNMVAGANFPDKATAEKVAARLHKFGINIVRLHHMDADWAKPNIFDPAFPDKQHLSADALDRLDYFVAQLKQHGIYVNINLHVAREFTKADGFPETDQLHDYDKAVDFFVPRMIELQQNYARDLLTHRNAYTNLRYVDDPAVACIEINNENTLLGEAWSTKLDSLPPYYKKELAGLWNAWLKHKYGDLSGLKRAWTAADKPFGPNILQNALFEMGAIHWNVEMNTPPAEAKLTLPDDAEPPSGVKGRVARLSVSKLGAQNWHLQFHQGGLELVEGEPYTLSFWARADRTRKLPVYTSLDKDDYHHTGLDTAVELTKDWQEVTLRFTATRPLANHNRLTFVLGDALGDIDLAGITLRTGAEFPFPSKVSLETSTVPLGHPLNNPEGQDWIAFLIDTERVYMTNMRDYVKNTLKAKANVAGSQASWAGLGGALRESIFDYADNHAYWQHPNFPNKPWDPKDWNITNTAMTRSGDGGTLPDLARYRLAKLPYTVSEYHHPAPNEYRAETIPLMAAFASVQDWDGFYLFDYHAEQSHWDAENLHTFFDVDSDPAIMAFLPAAALIFQRYDMPLAHHESRLHIGRDDVPELMAKNGPAITAEWQDASVSNPDTLKNRLSIAIDTKESKKSGRILKTGEARQSEVLHEPESKSAITWTDQGTDRALFRADSPSSKVIVGYIGGQRVQISGFEVQALAQGHNFAAMTLCAVDGRPTEQSRSLLMTVLCNVENRGMVWNAEHTSVGDQWGSGPTIAITPTATIHINTHALKAVVYALDATGKRGEEVASTLSNGVLTFTISPDHKAVWYEIKSS